MAGPRNLAPGIAEDTQKLQSCRGQNRVSIRATRRPYQQFNFVHRVAEVIDRAGLAGKRYGDLRRSAVVRLAMAGCTIPMIASITGHSYSRCEEILEVYLPRSTELARIAIERVLTARAK